MHPPAPISAILAVADNGVIGRHNALPWHLPADFRYFKSVTLGHPVIMGRKTYESLGGPLPGRLNIVLSRRSQAGHPGVRWVPSLDEAIRLAREEVPEEIFIIGGATIYRQAWPQLDKLYLTRVHARPLGDAFFHLSPDEGWRLVSARYRAADTKNLIPMTFEIYERVR